MLCVSSLLPAERQLIREAAGFFRSVKGVIPMKCKVWSLAKGCLPMAALSLLVLFSSGLVQGQITSSGDSHTNTADATTNYGAKTLLDVDGASQITYIQFNLASIPTTASVSQATLKLYVNSVTTATAPKAMKQWKEARVEAAAHEADSTARP